MRIEHATRTLHLDDGSTLSYTGLCLATGARARRPEVPGAGLGHVCMLRNMADTRALAAILPHTSQVVVIGGGFIGLEFASIARRLGKQVVVLEAADRLMARVVSPQLSDFFLRLHRDNGATIELGANVSALSGSRGVVTAVHTADGRVFPADLVVVGIGVIPNGELAQQAGLACDRGALIVDACARSSSPGIVGAGDCTVRQRAGSGLLRLESVQNAIEQAKSAAAHCWASTAPTLRCPGSGRSSTRSGCKWPALPQATRRRWCAATWRPERSPSSTTPMANSAPWTRSIGHRIIWRPASCSNWDARRRRSKLPTPTSR